MRCSGLFVVRSAALVALAGAAVASCKPWTVRPIENTAAGTPTASARFDAAAYVESIWAARVEPTARTSAIELSAAVLGRTGPEGSTILVRGSGVVSAVDTQSRVGLALVDLAPGDGRPDVALQIGPVLRGTAVRDALPFIRFGDFANQLEFADVANALNARVVRTALAAVDAATLTGRSITFWGAMRINGASGERLPEVVPVILQGGTP
jgi:predicted lipoprotein